MQCAREVDPVTGDDANPPGKPWKSFGRLNAVKLVPGDTVIICPGVQVARVTDKEWLITLKDPVPMFNEGDVIDNITWNPNITARGNHVSVDPVRGFLLGTRGRIIIENNTFERCRMPGIFVEGDAVKWFESSPIRDMLIRGNRFIDRGIVLSSTVLEPMPGEPVHEGIQITGNTFENGGISAMAVKGLVIRDNQAFPSPPEVNVDASCTEARWEGDS